MAKKEFSKNRRQKKRNTFRYVIDHVNANLHSPPVNGTQAVAPFKWPVACTQFNIPATTQTYAHTASGTGDNTDSAHRITHNKAKTHMTHWRTYMWCVTAYGCRCDRHRRMEWVVFLSLVPRRVPFAVDWLDVFEWLPLRHATAKRAHHNELYEFCSPKRKAFSIHSVIRHIVVWPIGLFPR